MSFIDELPGPRVFISVPPELSCDIPYTLASEAKKTAD